MSSGLPACGETTFSNLSVTDEVVCHCLQIRRSDIKTAADMLKSPTVRCIIKSTDAGSGCTACHARIRRLLAEHAEETRSASRQVEPA